MMKRHEWLMMAMLTVMMTGLAWATTSWDLQAVDSSGAGTYEAIGTLTKVTITGIVLNNSEDILDGSYNAPAYMGGQWQIFVQGIDGDHAGTTLWMGQKYSRMGGTDYSEADWASEMARVNYDGDHQIQAGDLISVTGYVMDRNGKVMINERHSSSPLMDFTVDWLDASPGLPSPEVITLDAVKDSSDQAIFDSTRLTGGEYYQGQLVRINDVQFTADSISKWAPGATLTITDGQGHTLPVVLGLGAGFQSPSNLNGTFDIVGIFNQENSATSGYQLWVTQYDGGSDFLGVPEPMTLAIITMGIGMVISKRRG